MATGQLSLKGRALRLLSGREHSRVELERALAGHEAEPGQLSRILDELQAKGFINEQRVIESVLHRRAARLGVARIRHELQGKGLDPERVARAVEELQSTELQRAREVWRKKFGAPPGNSQERGRQARFLASRGFGGDVIRRLLSAAPEETV
jgi:regulatory protein